MAKFNNIIVYDLETGGFVAGEHGVCEIAMIGINIETLEEIGRYEAIIQQYNNQDGDPMKYTQKAFQVNGLSFNKLEQLGKPAKQVAEEVCSFAKTITSGKYKPILAGHNIKNFDNPHLADFLDCNKQNPLKFFDGDSIDTYDWARMAWGADKDMPHLKLGDCCKRFGIELTNAHSAMPDTEANAKLLIQFLKLMKGESAPTSGDKEIERFRKTFNF